MQLYCLCDMAADTVQALAGTMQLQLSGMEQYAGGIILPKGLYRALDKAERGARAMLLPASVLCYTYILIASKAA